MPLDPGEPSIQYARLPRGVLAFWVSGLLMLFAGCQDGDSRLVPVAGVVSVGGEPLAGAVVEFEPVPGRAGDLNFNPSSKGTTDEEGRFVLKTSFGSGAVVGEHTVKVWVAIQTAAEEDAAQGGKLKVVLLSELQEEELRITVPGGGTGDATFAFGPTEAVVLAVPLPDSGRGRSGRWAWRAPLCLGVVVLWAFCLRGCYRWWRYNEQRVLDGV
ncbi:MAG: hypothetical protein HUU20_04200 [Pirellulales bacterium]|nr:hypothetical protein [Pirellulales bacterium]